jgi:hypothetical protein
VDEERRRAVLRPDCNVLELPAVAQRDGRGALHLAPRAPRDATRVREGLRRPAEAAADD